MKKPNVICPACKAVHKKMNGDFVVICGIIYEQFEIGMSNFPNYTIEPSHCQNDRYTKCQVWRGAKDADWAKEAGKYSSLEQMEKIRL
jgi:hypothetical protein